MNISVSLTPELIGIIKAQVASGRYASTSEVVREALRLLDRVDRRGDEQTEELRGAWQDGIESGDAGPLDFDALRLAAERERAAEKKE